MPDDRPLSLELAAIVAPDPAMAADMRFAEFLIERGKMTAADLQRARGVQARDDRLCGLLAKLGVVSEQDIADAFASYLQMPLARTADYPETALLGDRVSVRFLKAARIVPLQDEPAALTIAMADPLDLEAVRAMELIARKPVSVSVGIPADIDAALARLHGAANAGALGEMPGDATARDEGKDEDIERLKDMASEAPVIRLVNFLIKEAVEARASDIHIESYENRLRVRYRIDGLLRDIDGPPRRLGAAVISRIKIMAKLNIAERRLPQDGRMKLAVRGKDVEFRVATLPTMHGENAVLRVLDRSAVSFDFAQLGFSEAVLQRYMSVLRRPHGILLVTGPTGSGKTTTLYTSLLALNAPEVKILTVEDPIEYQLDGVNQVQVKPQIDLTFANALRSLLRQDPDVVMIGEIRDTETARIAVQAALTGHLVLSTLHTNDAASTVSRLLDMGVEDYLLNSTLNGVLAQRLVRKLCPYCRQDYALPADQADEMLQGERPSGEVRLYRPQGCARCNGTGYRGRCSIVELLVMSDAMRTLVLQRADGREIESGAVREGMRTMFWDGFLKAQAGITSLEEVLRVTRGGGDGGL
jgi:general secretion pathway protein E